jgi:hypothetical protein
MTKLKPHRLLHWDVRWRAPFEDFVHLGGGAGDVFPLLPRVRQEATSRGKCPAVADCWQAALDGEIPQPREVTRKPCDIGHEYSVGTQH